MNSILTNNLPNILKACMRHKDKLGGPYGGFEGMMSPSYNFKQQRGCAMSDLNDLFLKTKAAEEDKDHLDRKCLTCFNFVCTCIPAAAMGEEPTT